MSRKIHQPHDKFMKSLLEDKEMAVEFFKAFLPESIIKKIDLSGLEHSSRSFISENLRETQADIVFTCPLKERKDEEVYLCLIVGEHKNKPDRYVSIQLGGYTFDGYRQQLSDKTQPLKVILPFLYYHGSGNWDPPYLRELFEYDVSAFLDYIPDFEMVFQNIQGYTDQEIRRLGNALLTSALLTQKYSDRPQMLVDRFNQIFSILGSWTDRNLFKSLIVYFIELVEIEGEELEIMIQKIPDVMKTEFVSLADRLRESGRKEGRTEGIHEKDRIATENMLRRGFDVSAICDILEVTPEFVEKVRKSMKL